MDLGGLVRAVNSAFQDGAKLVTRIRDERADSDRALPEDPTRDLLDSLQLGPLLVKGQYDRDLKRFGEQLVCGDAQAREQMKDVLINLQMALIISLRGVSMDNGDLDFDALQQTSDDCRTNAGVCLGQLSQRLSDAAKAEAMMPEQELQPPKFSNLGYSSSRSTRSTRSSGRDPRTPTENVHDQYTPNSIASNTATVKPAHKERQRAGSSASKRGHQPRRPTTPQSQESYGHQTTVTHRTTERRLRGVPSEEVLTPPDEETLQVIRKGYGEAQHASDRRLPARTSTATRADSGYISASYTSRRQAGYGGVPSMASSRSNGSSRPGYAPIEQMPVRSKFGGISSQPVSYASQESRNDYGFSTLDDPTTSEEEDIMSLRRPSSHALGIDEHEMLSPTVPMFHDRPESSAKSYVVSLPDADMHEPSSPISAVSEEDEEDLSDHKSIMVSPEMLAAEAYRPSPRMVQQHQYEVDDTTPTLGSGEFGHATVYETSRIRPVDTMPRELPPPRLRQPRQDSLSRLRESRLISSQAVDNGRSTPQRSHEEVQATLRQAEARVRHHRNRPLQHSGSVRAASTNRGMDARSQHVAYMQQEDRTPRHLVDLPLPPPPLIDLRPDSRNNSRQKVPQAYKVFPAQTTPPNAFRNGPAPPPNSALPAPPPGRGPKWLAEATSTGIRPSTSPIPPHTLQRASDPTLRPGNSVPDNDEEVSALPQDGPGPSEPAESLRVESPPPTAISKTLSKSSGPRMVKIVPMHMAMYGGTYTGAIAPKPEKPLAPPMPLTLPLQLPNEKNLLGFCKGAHRTFLGTDTKVMKLSSRPVGISGNMHFWVCHKCHFQGPVVTVSRTISTGKKGKEKVKEEKIFDPKPRSSPVRGLDGELGGVRYKWAFLAKCHIPLKAMTEELAMGAGAAGKGEWGGFGCLFCCAEGVSRGWVDKDAQGKLVVADGLSVRSGSTASGETHKSSNSGGKGETPIFKDMAGFMAHLEMHRKEDCWPGQEMTGRMKCIVGRRALDEEEWEVNFLPLKIEDEKHS